MADPKKPRRSGVELAEKCTRRLNALKAERTPWEPLWDEQMRLFCPRQARLVYQIQSQPNTSDADVLYDTTGVYALNTYSAGLMSYMTPGNTNWFTLTQENAPEPVERWLTECTEIMRKELATNSNFYSVIHQSYIDDGGIGTSVVTLLEGRKKLLTFAALPVGSYWISQNDEGEVDTLYRTFELTAEQCVDKFGEEKLSPNIRKAFADFLKDGKSNPKFTIGHCIEPRKDSEREYKKVDGQNKPWCSIYWEIAANHTISEGGYDEQPFFASRHLTWGDSVYGWAPAFMAAPEERQANFLSMQMQALAEITAFPRVTVPDTMVDEIDMRAGGVTIVDSSNPNVKPSEWLTGGRYDVGKDMLAEMRRSVERHFFVPMFNMFGEIDKQMTAREVVERAAEKQIQVSPAFARKNIELISPILVRCFGMMLRAGRFPVPPPEAIVNGEYIPDPDITYSSILGLAIQKLENASFNQEAEIFLPLIQIDPTIIDNFEMDTIIRDTSRNSGLPASWIRKLEDVQKMREARAEQQQQMMQMEQAKMASEAAKNVGSIPASSPVAQAVAQA